MMASVTGVKPTEGSEFRDDDEDGSEFIHFQFDMEGDGSGDVELYIDGSLRDTWEGISFDFNKSDIEGDGGGHYNVDTGSHTHHWVMKQNGSILDESNTISFSVVGPSTPTISDPIPSDGTIEQPDGDNDDYMTLSVVPEDPAGDSMDVTFYDVSDDSVIDSNTGESSGSRSYGYWDPVSRGTTYSWYAEAEDPDGNIGSTSTLTFTVNQLPDSPSNPDPSDGETVEDNSSSVPVYFSVDISDPDGQDMLVDFYVDGVMIGDTTDETWYSSGTTVNGPSESYDANTTHDWHVEVQDESNEVTVGPTWTFHTNRVYAPDPPDNPHPSDNNTVSTSTPTLQVDVYDSDGDNMDVRFYIDGNLEDTDYNVNSGDTASINASSLSDGTHDWYTIADDGDGTTSDTQSSTWTFTVDTNDPPNSPTATNPASNEITYTGSVKETESGVLESGRRNIELSIDVSDPDADSMDVTFYDASDDSVIGTDSGVADGGTASIVWNKLAGGQSHSWYVVIDDGEVTTTSSTYSFTAEPDEGIIRTR